MYHDDEYLDASILDKGPFSHELGRRTTMKFARLGLLDLEGVATSKDIHEDQICLYITYISRICSHRALRNSPDTQEAREFNHVRQPPSPRDTIDTY